MFGSKLWVLAVGLTTTGLMFSPGVAEAAKGKKKGDKLEALFKKLDTNNDGKLSPAEFAKLSAVKKAAKTTTNKTKKKAAQSAGKKGKKASKTGKKGGKAKKGNKAGKKGNKSTALFHKLDTNKDGSLSLSEFEQLKQVKQQNKAAKGNKAKKNKT